MSMKDKILTAYGFETKQYDIIYADPPWDYNDKANAGKRGASHKYPCMSLEDIMALPVKRLAAPNSVLFMWHVGPQPMEALKVVEAWGFRLTNMKAFTWVKLNKHFASVVKKTFKISPEELKTLDDAFVLQLMHTLTKMGMGHWTRGNTEDVLIAVRGRPQRFDAGVKQTVFAPHTGKHSAKPAEVRDRIVEVAGDKTRIELFSRGRYPGWDVWGNQLPKESKSRQVA